MGRTLYFCIPPNEKLLAYWDTVADRLFKIRHCMDIEGVVRPLALFDPPLDPGMLVKAAAAGIDVGSIVSALDQPIGPVRSQLLIQKALELASEVRGFGNALLAALEKGDSEHLATLRQDHEIKLQLTQDVRFLQWRQAQAATETLLKTRGTALERYKYYLRLLGQQRDSNAPDTLPLDRSELTEDNFDDAFQALVGQYDNLIATQSFPALKLAGDTSPSNQSRATGTGSLFLNTNEDSELNNHLPMARDARTAASALNTIAAVVTFIPELMPTSSSGDSVRPRRFSAAASFPMSSRSAPISLRPWHRGRRTRPAWSRGRPATSAVPTSGCCKPTSRHMS
jgi:hypothetical protein